MTKQVRAKNRLSKYIGLLVGIIFFRPLIIQVDPRLNSINAFISIAGIVVSMLLLGRYLAHTKLKISKQWMMLLLFCGWLILSSIINYSAVLSQIEALIFILGIFTLPHFLNNNYRFFLRGLNIYCITICISNIVSQILFPKAGLYYNLRVSWQPYYICGNGNSFVFFYLFSLLIMSLDFFYGEKRRFPLVVVIYEVVLLYSVLLGQSTTGFIILLIYTLLTIFTNSMILSIIKKHYRLIIVLVGILFVYIVLLGGWKTIAVQKLIFDFTRENANFTNRGEIWESAIGLVKQEPIFGYGAESFGLAIGDGGRQRSAHNNFLQIMLLGGIPALCFYIGLILSSVKHSMEIYKEKPKEVFVIITVVFLYIISFFFEQNPYYVGFFYCLTINSVYKRINRKQGEK